MAEEASKFAKDGKLSKTLMKTWGQDQLERLWTELIQTAITSPIIADGQRKNNKQKLKEIQLILIVKIVEHFVGEHLGTENAIHATNIAEETKRQDQPIQKRLKD